MMRCRRALLLRNYGRSEAGLSLVELMVAMTIGLVLVGGLFSVFISNSRARDHLSRASQLVENGRYAIQTISDDASLAGYWAEFDLVGSGLAAPTVKPDPCNTNISSLSSVPVPLTLQVQGYYSVSSSTPLTCISDVKLNTDVLVVRRASSCVAVSGSTTCPQIANTPYFQASLCDTEISAGGTNGFRIATNTGSLDRHLRDCTTLAGYQQYDTHIYFIANNDTGSDGVPTLKRADLGAGGFTVSPIADGIENMRIEYGLDIDGDGVPERYTADPDSYAAGLAAGAITSGCTQSIWCNVVSIRFNMLARGPSATNIGFVNTNTYALGLNPDNSVNTIAAANDKYERHVFTTEVAIKNISGRRQSDAAP
jgi:type IV pilus assembly protein PilW